MADGSDECLTYNLSGPLTVWSREVVDFIVPSAPKTFFYMPDFLDPDAEGELMKSIYAAGRWKCLSHRRLQIWGGTPHPNGMIAEKIPEWLHGLMDRISDLGVFGPNRANHVLINEYKPGQGIMPHHDGSLYYPVVATVNLGGHSVLDFYKPITTETLNASLIARYVGSALLMPRSLNMVTESLYTYFMHGIEEREIDYLPQIKGSSNSLKYVGSDDQIEKRLFNLLQIPNLEDSSHLLQRQKRISVTIRYVPKTRNVNLLRAPR
ncbi:Alpha-ketoglutarate-dependent dioxygenase alkB -like protein 6 [Echinococcus granulosus]|nr:Alpha-ketoglutarate-dependent dioxygenase alkB -like protein 6 [Echinococcus granulosus]